MEKVRLSKIMAHRGLCSRREGERYITEGRVRVEGVLVTEVGTKVSQEAQIRLDQKGLKRLTVALHKPLGIVSNLPQGREKEAKELLTFENRFDKGGICIETDQLHVIGRLDIHSKGLLLFSSDGRVAKKIIGPRSNVEKEYVVRFEHTISREIVQKLSFGLALDGKPLKRILVRPIGNFGVTMVLKEGRNRQIRRMCALLKLKVSSLKRVRIGTIQLGSLPLGKWRVIKT